MVVSVETDISGKSILPLPSLVQAVAAHQLVIDEAEFKSSVWSPAISLLIKDLSDAISETVRRKTADDEFPNPGWDRASKLYSTIFSKVVVAELTTFSSYRLVQVKEVASQTDTSNLKLVFTRSDAEDATHWKRTYDYSVYNGYKRYQYNVSPLTKKCMYAPWNTGGKAESTNKAGTDLILAQNDRCFNQFGKRYGITISESMHIQSQEDASLSLLKQFASKN